MNLIKLSGDGWRYTAEKTPSEAARVPLNVASWITAGDTVTGTTLVTTPTGITATIDNGATSTPLLTIAGGTHGQRYKLPLLVTTNYGLKIQITIFVDIKNHTLEAIL